MAAIAVVPVVMVACAPAPAAPPRIVTTVAGTAGVAGSADGVGAAARFDKTYGAALDSAGNLFVADSDDQPNLGNHTIRKVTPSGVVSTFAGAAGSRGSADGVGSTARFNNPQGIAVDRLDNLYVADTGNHTIRRISPTGVVTTIAGKAGIAAHVDGSALSARLYFPYGVAVDDALNVYVVGGDDTVRRIAPGGSVSTIAGVSMSEGTADGTGSSARFNEPWGIAATGSGTLFIADQQSHTVRRVTVDGIVSTVAGSPGVDGFADGTGALFRLPSGISLEPNGSIVVADMGNHTIRRISQAGVVSTVAGAAGQLGSSDGTTGAARFRFPTSVAAASDGRLWIVDSGNRTIRRIS
ncbi:MAG: NHL repeat-containing protein [Microthrixaceae bacterium]